MTTDPGMCWPMRTKRLSSCDSDMAVGSFVTGRRDFVVNCMFLKKKERNPMEKLEI